ncbi:hypothetical protein ACHAXN_006051 [Cyclotella atomus]
MSSNSSSDEVFRRRYAKAIAEALQAKEEEEQKLIGTKQTDDGTNSFERAKYAYSQLCHDDPILSSDTDCRYLAKALTPRVIGSRVETGKLGLCTRLVDGLLQALARSESQAAAKPQSLENDKLINEESFGALGVASREGYAQLAFAIFVEGPYRCIQQADNLSVTSSFLGSLDIPEAKVQPDQLSNEEKSRLVDEATQSIVDGIEKMALDERRGAAQTPREKNDDASSSSSEFFHHNKTNHVNTQKEDDSMEEICAEDSDPDDFDFGPDLGAQAYGMSNENDDVGFDPTRLSTASTTNKTWDGARNAILFLMSNMSYGKLLLSSLSTRAWLDLGVSETLADFSFMLLLHHTQQGAARDDSLLISSPDPNIDMDNNLDISALWDRPLFLLRDRALDSNCDHDALVPYLQLLEAFLNHSENDIMSILSSPTSKQSSLLPPITSVGLSGLAVICSSKELTCAAASKVISSALLSICPREEVKKTILSSLYSLAHVLECVRPKKLDSSEEMMEHERLWVRTAACVFPIIEYVTNLRARFDYQPVFDGTGGKIYAFSDADAKCLLDSGMLRELLALSAAAARHSIKHSDGENANSAANVTRAHLLRTIYALCISSPEVLGKYAVRMPDIANEVQSSEFMKDNLIDGILWTSLSSSLVESKADAPAPRLKLREGVKLKTISAPVDDTSMAERSCSGFMNLCNAVTMALSTLKDAAEKEDEINSKEELDRQKKSLADIICLANCLANSSNATNAWVVSLNIKQDGAQQAKDKVIELRTLLSSIPSYSDDTITQCTGYKKNDDQNTEQEEHNEGAMKQKEEVGFVQRRKEFGKIVSSVRSSVKIISSALDSQKGRGLSLKGEAMCNISSKTD